jgi:outer membrane protein TolC
METNIAEENNSWGNAGRYPSVSIAGYSNNKYNIKNNVSNDNVLGTDLGLDWVLFNGFKVIATKNKLAQFEELAKGNASVLVENSIQDVILGYYMVLLNQEKLKVLKEVMELSNDRYKYELKKKELGSSVTYQVLQSKNNFLSDKVAFLTQEAALRNSQRDLDFFMGIDSLTNWSYIQQFSADTNEYVLNDLRERMYSNNNVLKNQYIGLQLKQYETKISRSDLYPSVSLSAGLSSLNPYTIDNSNVSLTNNNSFNAYENVSLSYNIFTGGTRKRAVHVAEINEEIAVTRIEEIKHVLNNQLMNGFDMYMVRKELLNVATENMETAKLNLDIASEKYKTGVINSFNYRDIQLVYINAAIEKSEAIYNIIEPHTELVRLTGGLIHMNE